MSSECEFYGCKSNQDRGSTYCIGHRKLFGTPTPKKTQGKIRNRSLKRTELQKEYVKVVQGLLSENKNCQINAPGCTKFANGLHHIVKRAEKNLCELNNLIRACNSCNLYLEENDKWARDNGFVKSKFDINI